MQKTKSSHTIGHTAPISWSHTFQKSHILSHKSSVCQISVGARKSRDRKTKYLYLDIRLNRERKRLNTGYKISQSNWDSKEKKVIGVEGEMINSKLYSQKEEIHYLVHKLEINGQFPTLDRVLSEFNQKSKYTDFISYYEIKLEERYQKDYIQENTYKAQRKVLHKLKQFKSKIPFAQITEETFKDFDKWNLHKIKETAIKQGREIVKNAYNTRQGCLKEIRTYLNLAEKDKIYFSKPKIKVKWITSSRESLNKDQLHQLIKAFVEQKFKGTTHYTLASFLFICSTGLRISDFLNLRKENLQNGVLTFDMAKNRKNLPKTIAIPANQIIIELFNYIIQHKSKRISQQKMNQKLKLIALELEIKTKISLHVGRNTFATLYLENGGNLSILQKILGHSSMKTTEIYNKTTDLAKAKEMQNFASVFNLADH